jgi:hypothetical protein
VDHRLRALAAGHAKGFRRHAINVYRSRAHDGEEMLYQDADHRLRAFASRAEGFVRHAIGDLNRVVYHVTSLQGGYLTFYHYNGGRLSR